MKVGLSLVDSNESMSANYTSPPIMAEQSLMMSIQAVWSGSPVGSFELQTSLDYQPGGAGGQGGPAPVAGTWDLYAGSGQDTTGVNSCTWNISYVPFRWIRAAFVFSSGSGTLLGLRVQQKGV